MYYLAGSQPLAASTPLERVVEDPDNGLSYKDIANLVHSGDDHNLPFPDFQIPELNEESRISVPACSEIILHVVSDAQPELAVGLLQALCFFLEKDLMLQESETCSQQLAKVARPLLPSLIFRLRDPLSGPWVARIISVFYRNAGIVPLDIVLSLREAIESATDAEPGDETRIALRDAALASLRSLQNLRPDIIKKSSFPRDNHGRFPRYADVFQLRLPPEPGIKRFLPEETYDRRRIFPLLKKKKWYTPSSLVQNDTFVRLWKKVRLPEHYESILTDETLQTLRWILPTIKSSRKQTELRSMNLLFDRLSQGHLLDSEDRVIRVGVDSEASQLDLGEMREIFQLVRDCRDTMHDQAAFHVEVAPRACTKFVGVFSHLHNFGEQLPAVSRMVLRLLNDASTSNDLFILALENLSLFMLSGSGQSVDDLFRIIDSAFAAADDFSTKLRLLTALYQSIEDFQRDLPRLWYLEAIQDMDDRYKAACVEFVHEETAKMACDCDNAGMLKSFLNMLDSLLWNPLVVKEPGNRAESIRLWDLALRIWNVLAAISLTDKTRAAPHVAPAPSTAGKRHATAVVPLLIPHPGLLRVGMAHFMRFISNRVKEFAARFIPDRPGRRVTSDRLTALRHLCEEFQSD